jgi:hypothetical protein
MNRKIQSILNGTADRDPMNMFRSAKTAKIVQPEIKKKEIDVHIQVCKYLKLQYPGILFLSDFAAGIKMSIGMANRQKMMKSDHSFPDLMIFEPRGGYKGLFIELKRDRDALYNKDGSFKSSDHIADQYKTLNELRKKGYYAYFACGFDVAKNIIDNYLNL